MGFTAFAAFTFVVSQAQARKARKKQEAAQAAEERLRKKADQKARREQIRQERIRRAALEARLQAGGAGGSSAEATGLGSLRSQLESNLGYQASVSREQDTIFNLQGQASAYQGRAELFGQLSSISGSAARQYGGSPPKSQDDDFRFFNY